MIPMHEVPGSALPGPAAIETSGLSKREWRELMETLGLDGA